MPDLRSQGPLGLAGETAGALTQSLERGEITSVDIVEACLARIAARDPHVKAWAHIDREAALAQARARDAEPRRSVLHGIPVGIKDIFDTFDMPTTYGSPLYAGHRPASDSAVVGLLRMAGAVILGKCVTTEFASPVPAGTRNPHDLTRSPGVSSSGSAAAVADFHVPLALGSQTGGSTILPASFCGVVGYKASLTGIDRGGIRHLRPTLDTIGLFARSVDDIARLRAALVEHAAPDTAIRIDRRPRIGVCRSINWETAEPSGKAVLESAAAALTKAEMPPQFQGIEDSFRVISTVEGSRALRSEMAGHLPQLNHYIQASHIQAQRHDQAAYDRAQQHALRCRSALAEVFARCDVLITPAAAGEAVADLVSVSNSGFNRIWTLMHTPALSLPLFTGAAGMPVGLQVVGPIGHDDHTIAMARWIGSRLASA
jgi:Asp-tRNA(Asn)/Glu-tRNA(Gln) amidotransferase A subunit family amidase